MDAWYIGLPSRPSGGQAQTMLRNRAIIHWRKEHDASALNRHSTWSFLFYKQTGATSRFHLWNEAPDLVNVEICRTMDEQQVGLKTVLMLSLFGKWFGSRCVTSDIPPLDDRCAIF